MMKKCYVSKHFGDDDQKVSGENTISFNMIKKGEEFNDYKHHENILDKPARLRFVSICQTQPK